MAINIQKKAPKAIEALSSSVFAPICFSIISLRGLFGGLAAAAIIKAKMSPTTKIGIHAMPINKGPKGIIQSLADQAARNITRKNSQNNPHGPLFLNTSEKMLVINRAMMNITPISRSVIFQLLTLSNSKLLCQKGF
jgi:hypothetical protein